MGAQDTGLGAYGRINLIDKTLIKPLNATAKKTKFNTKSITYSESTSKIMVRSRWTVFEILLMSARDFMEECLTMFNRVTKNVLTLSINY